MKKSTRHERALRRDLYLGENLRVILQPESGFSFSGEIIGLSEKGLGFLCDPHHGDHLAIGRTLDLKIYYDARRSFQTRAQVRNLAPFPAQGHHYLRVGLTLQLNQPLHLEPDSKTVLLGPETCGYVEIENPIFFDEVDHFRLRGIRKDCVFLQPLSNRHVLLPGQPVQVRFQIPGSRGFVQDMQVVQQVQDHEWWNLLLMLRFQEPASGVLSKLAKFALINKPELTVRTLQEAEFPIPYLDFLLKVQYGQKELRAELLRELQGSFLAPHVEVRSFKQARQLLFYRTDKLIATARLNFTRDVAEESAFVHQNIYNYQFMKKPVVELVEFAHHPDYPMASLLVPILQHCLRASIQAQFQFFTLECTPQTAAIFSRLGFTAISADKADRSFMTISLKHGLHDLTQGVHHDTWERVYKRLHAYLHRKHPLARYVA
jgi:hypothetical protein